MLNPRRCVDFCWLFISALLSSLRISFLGGDDAFDSPLDGMDPKKTRTPLSGEGPARLAVTHRAQQEAAARVTAAKCADQLSSHTSY